MVRPAALIFTLLITISNLFAAVEAKYADSSRCQPCHTVITNDWKHSLHARSHFSKNELYDKMLAYVAKKRHQSKARLQIRCAQCHNPRVGEAVDEETRFAAAFGLDDEVVESAMQTPFIKDGVNCIVCHNIKKIHPSKDPGKRGKDTIEWGPNDTMFGPFKNARSPYHKTAYAPFFKKDPNRLCFVCHYNERSVYGTLIGTTGEEYKKSKTKRTCVECHMGPEVRGHAVNKRIQNSTASKSRYLRHHLFAGVRGGALAEEAIDLQFKRKGQTGRLRVINRTPHRFPTGFGDRLAVLKIRFQDRNGKTINQKTYPLRARFLDKKGRETVSFLAVKKGAETRLKPFERRTIVFKIPKKAASLSVTLNYYAIAPEWAKRLGIQKEEFLRPYPIAGLKFDL